MTGYNFPRTNYQHCAGLGVPTPKRREPFRGTYCASFVPGCLSEVEPRVVFFRFFLRAKIMSHHFPLDRVTLCHSVSH